MSAIDARGPTQAVATLASNRAEARALFGANSAAMPIGGEAGAFPRSKTFRWLLRHPIGRWVGSAVITGALARIPLGKFVAARLFLGKT